MKALADLKKLRADLQKLEAEAEAARAGLPGVSDSHNQFVSEVNRRAQERLRKKIAAKKQQVVALEAKVRRSCKKK